MNGFRRLILDLCHRFTPRRSQDADEPLQVFNITRHTQLADCVEVACNGAKRAKGLLGRNGLELGTGMWIVPCEAVHTIGMQFPIDLVYLDRKHHVRKVRSNVPPWHLSACLTAHSVIELAAGVVNTTQTAPGDVLEFSRISSGSCSQHPPDQV
jgi:uncharacterized membrane protein (UPF0127 family)